MRNTGLRSVGLSSRRRQALANEALHWLGIDAKFIICRSVMRRDQQCITLTARNINYLKPGDSIILIDGRGFFGGTVLTIDKSLRAIEILLDCGQFVYRELDGVDSPCRELFLPKLKLMAHSVQELSRGARKFLVAWAQEEVRRLVVFRAARTIQMAYRKYVAGQKMKRAREIRSSSLRARSRRALQHLGGVVYLWRECSQAACKLRQAKRAWDDSNKLANEASDLLKQRARSLQVHPCNREFSTINALDLFSPFHSISPHQGTCSTIRKSGTCTFNGLDGSPHIRVPQVFYFYFSATV